MHFENGTGTEEYSDEFSLFARYTEMYILRKESKLKRRKAFFFCLYEIIEKRNGKAETRNKS